MTQTSRSTMDMLDDRANVVIYAATLGACVASAAMLFAPDRHADGFMALAWACMAVSAVSLAGKLCIGMFASRGGVGTSGRVDA